MKEHEAFAKAQDNAKKTGETWFIVTSREQEGYDYDVATAGSLDRQTVVCGMVESAGGVPKAVKVDLGSAPVKNCSPPTLKE